MRQNALKIWFRNVNRIIGSGYQPAVAWREFEKGVDAMIGLLTTILLSLSICLFAAHAYDAYRTR
jgi:hypothetical protein